MPLTSRFPGNVYLLFATAVSSATYFAPGVAFAQDAPAPDAATQSAPAPPTAPTPAPDPIPADATAEEAAEELKEEDPSRPPPKGKGAVWGVITDSDTKDTLIEAQVFVLGKDKRVLTDVDGRYRIELPPGDYDFRVVYELHQTRRLKRVRVVAGKTRRIDVPMESDKEAHEELSPIEADIERASAAAQIQIRRNAATASDGVGAQDIAKTPDRNAADASRRVVGVTLVEGRYLFVRGLGERYSNALLNGAPLPSPEPDRQAVPLDIFPTAVLSDVTVSKTFVPDMPGDFAGGSVNIHTRDLPPKFQFQANVGLGFNTETTFQRRLSHQGGSTDWLGIDDGGRKLPSVIPNENVQAFVPGASGRNPRLTEYGRAMNSPMTTTNPISLPNGTISAYVGNSIRFGKKNEQAFGYQFAAGYSRRFVRRNDEILRNFNPDPQNPGQLILQNDYRANTGLDLVAWNGLSTLTYAPSLDHRFTLTGLYSRGSEKEGREITGPNAERNGAVVYDTRLRFVSRDLAFGQLRGEHRFPSTMGTQIAWTGTASRAKLDEPNTRETVYSDDPTLGRSWLQGTLSGSHFYAKQSETTYGGSVDVTQPVTRELKATKNFKFGGLITRRHREFNARRFRYTDTGQNPGAILLPPDQLFTNPNIGDAQDGTSALELTEYTRKNDAYNADHNVYAGYLMGDFWFGERLRAIVGARVESSTQTIDSFDPHVGVSTAVQAKLAKTDLLPSANLIFKVTEASNLRLSASRTVARPQLRELAPFSFTDYFGAREIEGNPNLDRTRINNYDVRFEWFPGEADVLAATAFAKSFDKPIEPIIISQGRGVLSYQNARGATNLGIELEARKQLGFISKALQDFSVLSNLTLVHSRVELDSGPGQVQTSNVRPLAQQSPFIVNFAIDYNHESSRTRIRVLYNIFGERIAQVGQLGLPDIYEQPRSQLDASITQGIGKYVDLKLAADNLLDAPYRFLQADNIVQRYKLGTSVWLSATVNIQ
ncbi:TonB-dependent receptor [Pendulispora brunnea]|uniref:TonB-dependent receptor n=1 Tax=Pendulispora brunnea TaxID=2905690 RepID=A0ABZ2KQH9_9BACT